MTNGVNEWVRRRRSSHATAKNPLTPAATIPHTNGGDEIAIRCRRRRATSTRLEERRPGDDRQAHQERQARSAASRSKRSQRPIEIVAPGARHAGLEREGLRRRPSAPRRGGRNSPSGRGPGQPVGASTSTRANTMSMMPMSTGSPSSSSMKSFERGADDRQPASPTAAAATRCARRRRAHRRALAATATPPRCSGRGRGGSTTPRRRTCRCGGRRRRSC